MSVSKHPVRKIMKTKTATLQSKGTLLLLLAAMMIGYAFIVEGSESTSAIPNATPGLGPLTTALPPADLNTPQFWPEQDFPAYAYCPGSYPDYAEAYPDAPCATWENGGLTWSFLNELTGWGTVVWLPVYRFCGIPWPYPAKPDERDQGQPPSDWLEWHVNQLTSTPAPASP